MPFWEHNHVFHLGTDSDLIALDFSFTKSRAHFSGTVLIIKFGM
ncbi:MAG: hypothetical protein P8Y23_06095 [Candidatus Lokiarchaeota archaeon]